MSKKQKETINDICKKDKETFQNDLTHNFACQCGKLYKKFPGLYLHFQRSHKIKISTNVKQQFCVSSRKGNVRTFTYYYSNKSLKLMGTTENQSFLYQLLNQFIQSIQDQWDRYPAVYLCSNFHKYLLSQKQFNKQNVNELPTYFNAFMTENISLMRSQQLFNLNSQILMKLSHWLNLKGYSDLKVQINQRQDVNVESNGDFILANQPQNSTGVLQQDNKDA